MSGGAFPTTSALTSGNDPRRGSILTHILFGRKLLDCGPAGKCVNVNAVFADTAMLYCETALASDRVSNLLLRSTDGRYCHLSASQAEKMRPCHFVQQVELRCWPRASRTDGSPSAPPPPPTLKQTYTWEHTMTGRIRGVLVNSDQGRQSAIALEQDSDGIHWGIAANNIEDQQTTADCQRLCKDQGAGGIVFYAKPLIHGFL